MLSWKTEHKYKSQNVTPVLVIAEDAKTCIREKLDIMKSAQEDG